MEDTFEIPALMPRSQIIIETRLQMQLVERLEELLVRERERLMELLQLFHARNSQVNYYINIV